MFLTLEYLYIIIKKIMEITKKKITITIDNNLSDIIKVQDLKLIK